MAGSQLACMEDGRIPSNIPETKPEFYYSEAQRAAVEELLKNGDGAFKMRLAEDNVKDFLSAREIKYLRNTFQEYELDSDDEDDDDDGGSGGRHTGASPSKTDATADSGVHSTYWPQMSDTEVPSLDLGWPSGGLFRGVTRASVHTHPPKENGPHMKEVVRRLIQQASKVIAIVMDLLTDLQILQDLMDAAWRRSVAVYILLDARGVPHLLDMCSRLQIGAQHLQNIRTRSLQGPGFALSCGRLPGLLSNKYMLIDGEKVAFGSYSFSWCASRMDRNMIIVMTGQVVDFFDQDFRELYAVSDKIDLYKEFHITLPTNKVPPARPKVGPRRLPVPATTTTTTSRFQVSLGDSRKGNLKVPAHKYHNPKYFLAFGDQAGATGPLRETAERKDPILPEHPEEASPGSTQAPSSEMMDRLTPLTPGTGTVDSEKPPRGTLEKKQRPSLKQRLFSRKFASRNSVNSPDSSPCPSPTSIEASQADEIEDSFEVVVKKTSRWKNKKSSKMGSKSESLNTVNTTRDNESMKSQLHPKQHCTLS